MTRSMKERFIAALEARGETKVKETSRYVVMTRSQGGSSGFYYIGASGALRGGQRSPGFPYSRSFKEKLLAEAGP